ncbi:hypothetical protein AB0T83_18865 [Fluviibacterium sp. DFM31]|uniref:Peptidase S8/S53 domain-containing protein n=1 Tax=Meridianimarinicoccus marinus TaxID=3231483 RepID=A0ABV3LB83_9RHOB
MSPDVGQTCGAGALARSAGWATRRTGYRTSTSETRAAWWMFDQNFQPTDIVSTDVPGSAGYNPSPYVQLPGQESDEHLEVASLYCGFSGTSAATALAAGLVSLALALQRAGEQGDATPKHVSQPYKGPPPEEPELFTLEQAKKLVHLDPPTHSNPMQY